MRAIKYSQTQPPSSPEVYTFGICLVAILAMLTAVAVVVAAAMAVA